MPRYHRVFHPGHLQFITSSTYRRVPVLVSKWFCQIFAEVLGRVRQEFGFRLVGWVLMPDHFHLLIQRWGADLKGKVCASPSIKEVIDGLVYGLLTAGTFGWLWPR